MGGKTDLDRVVAYVPIELKKELEQWAQAEERSVSWLVAKLLERALQEHRCGSQPREAIQVPALCQRVEPGASGS